MISEFGSIDESNCFETNVSLAQNKNIINRSATHSVAQDEEYPEIFGVKHVLVTTE